MENLVAIDMSYSCLEEFEPPTDLYLLRILNFRSSKYLREIRNIYRLRYLEILILWNCTSLSHVTLGSLTCLAILNITGCKKLCTRGEISPLVSQEGSSLHAINSTQQAFFLLPQSLERLYLMNCNLSDTDYFPLTFKDQSLLIYLNLVNSPFEFLPSYTYLKSLRVLDVSGCSNLKELRCLPSTLAELYIYYCNLLNVVTFESHRFTLQEFGYEGCVNLCEVEGLFKLLPVTKLKESDLKHMTWIKEYQDLKVYLVGDAELTKGRSSCIQMLYEFNIMSTSLPYITNSNKMTDTDYMYTSLSTLLSFKVPACPEHRRLEGLILTVQYTTHGEDCVWFAKISTPSGVNLIYNPRVFGESGGVVMWSSYWPIGEALQIEETVNVSIVVIKGLDIFWCGANLVYSDGENEPLQENNECVGILGDDFSEFQLSTGAYYLCRRDFFELMEAGKLTPDWFRILVDDKIDYTEVGGWRMTGKPEHPYQSYTEVKSIRCIMYGPEMEEIYKIAELSKSSLVDITMESTSELSKAIPKTSDNQLSLADFDAVKVAGWGIGGTVRLVQHKWTGQFFALKVILINVEESGRKQIAQEFKIYQSCQCANVVVCYQSFYDNSALSIILEYMDGGSLAEFLKAVRFIPEPNLAAICKQVLKGLRYLHRNKNIIHRDLKPSNVLINHRGEVKITDFGISAILASTSGQDNTFVGTYNYKSPERITGGNYGYSSDIWSLGLVLLECATGSFPYSPPERGEGWVNVYELMETIVGQPAPRASPEQFSPQFCTFIEACMQKDPKDRASTNELMSHPFINMFDDMAVDLASYFTEMGSPLEGVSQVGDHLSITTGVQIKLSI